MVRHPPLSYFERVRARDYAIAARLGLGFLRSSSNRNENQIPEIATVSLGLMLWEF
jgi:hypothetical protein